MWYPTKTAKKIAKKLGRSTVSVERQARYLGLRKYNPLSGKQIDFIKKFYKKMTYAKLADKLGKSIYMMRHNIHALKLKKRKAKLWTNAEVKFLRKNYSNHNGFWLADRLRKRPVSTINFFARKLGLAKSPEFLHKQMSKNRSEWTEKELKFLRKNFSNHSDKWLAGKLKKPKPTILSTARRLHLNKTKKHRHRIISAKRSGQKVGF